MCRNKYMQHSLNFRTKFCGFQKFKSPTKWHFLEFQPDLFYYQKQLSQKKKSTWAGVVFVRRMLQSTYKIWSTWCLNGNLNTIVSFPKILKWVLWIWMRENWFSYNTVVIRIPHTPPNCVYSRNKKHCWKLKYTHRDQYLPLSTCSDVDPH